MILNDVTFAVVGETPPIHGGQDLRLGHRGHQYARRAPATLPELSSFRR
jgi:hypothetical protein